MTAAATELPQSQVGAQVTVIDRAALDDLGKVDVLEAIRTAPGLQVVQTGARGGATSLFVRGGNSNFNKILIDGVPANDIGGGVDLSQFATTGVETGRGTSRSQQRALRKRRADRGRQPVDAAWTDARS